MGKEQVFFAIYGGQDINRQIRALKNHPHIIVGTPGRLLDHINRKTMNLDHVQTVVLDEADEMLNMGFIEDIESILAQIPGEHQTLFSQQQCLLLFNGWLTVYERSSNYSCESKRSDGVFH